MRLGRHSTLADVAVAVGDALRRAGIRAVLTGGACASFYSAGSHQSLDADFVLVGACTRDELDAAMATLGFERDRDRYLHPGLPFFVEFPPGPLGIGEDFRIRPVWKRRRNARMLALSATDSCRDRLSAFYHWNDRQALAAAVAIALRERVNLLKVRRWSAKEGATGHFEAFRLELARARAARRARARPRAGKAQKPVNRRTPGKRQANERKERS